MTTHHVRYGQRTLKRRGIGALFNMIFRCGKASVTECVALFSPEPCTSRDRGGSRQTANGWSGTEPHSACLAR